jgi:hypothetical protein
MPRTARRLAALLFASATLVSLAACAPGEPAAPTPSPTATASDAPIFASDEEALAAAVAAYEAYLDSEQRITGSDEVDVQTIREVVSEDYASELIAEYESIRSSTLRLDGRGRIDSTRLVEYGSDDTSTWISMYACSDVGEVRVIDASGTDVTPQRDERVPVVIDLEQMHGEALLVAGSSKWSGDDFC